MPKVHHDSLTRSQSAVFVRKILVFIPKRLPRLSCVDFQDGSLWFLEGKRRFSKEQLLRNIRLLKKRKSVSS